MTSSPASSPSPPPETCRGGEVQLVSGLLAAAPSFGKDSAIRRLLTILVSSSAIGAALFAGGCAGKGYTHDVYVGGKLTEHYQITIIETPLMQFDAKSSHLRLRDGTVWDLDSPSTKADPNAMAAIQGVAQSVTMAAVAAIKFMGVP